jgi:hypothetical protein
MKRIYSFLLVFGILIVMPLLSSCASAPSDEIIQTTIVKTELVSTSTPIATFAPVATSFSTSTSTPFETFTATKDNGKQQLISEVIPLFEIGTSEAYAGAWNKLRLVGNVHGKYWNDEEIQALLWFSYDMINVANGNLYLDDFSLISPDYDGIYHEQISSEVFKHISRDEWERRYEINSRIMATVVAKVRLPLPELGMTAQQVRDSQWGEPNEIYKTITATVVYEQWVYEGNRYIFFENGIVVVIQE